MFTGLIENIGTIRRVTGRGNYREIVVSPDTMFENLTIGESIAVSGPCLTVTTFDKDSFTVEASQETIRLTTLKNLKNGQRVNLERALRADSRLGGHIVSGHIDVVLKIIKASRIGRSLRLDVELPEDMAKYVIDKGSVSLDGTSLTVMEVTSKSFAVNLIPETQNRTTLVDRQAGDEINIEFDLMGKYVLRYMDLAGRRKGLTIEKMNEWGY